MINQIEQVKDFMTRTGQEVNYSPTLTDSKTQQLRYELAKEELEEYRQACQEGDIIGIFDSLIDQLFVNIGTALNHGMSKAMILGMLEVYESNMTKIPKDGKILRNENGKIVKPEGYIKPDLDKVLRYIYS